MYFLPEDNQCDRYMQRVLAGLIQFVVVDGYMFIEF
jgi:hypothetical protein